MIAIKAFKSFKVYFTVLIPAVLLLINYNFFGKTFLLLLEFFFFKSCRKQLWIKYVFDAKTIPTLSSFGVISSFDLL